MAEVALLSGAFAALVAVGVTRAIELLGGTLGGLIATLPTTVVPAAIGLSFSADCSALSMPASAQLCNTPLLYTALFTLPMGMLASCLFLVVWRYLPPCLPASLTLLARLALMVLTSLSLWVVAALAITSVGRAILSAHGLPAYGAFGFFCFLLQGGLGIAACMAPLPAPKGSGAVPLPMLAARGVMAGGVICVAVVLSKTDGVASGLATAFPAIFLTIQVGLWLSQAAAVQGGSVGPMLLGAGSPGLFAMLYALAAPRLGVVLAGVLAWLGSVCLVSVPAWHFLQWRHSLQRPAGQPPVAAAAAAAAAAAGEGQGDAPLAVFAERSGGGAGEGESDTAALATRSPQGAA